MQTVYQDCFIEKWAYFKLIFLMIVCGETWQAKLDSVFLSGSEKDVQDKITGLNPHLLLHVTYSKVAIKERLNWSTTYIIIEAKR